MFEFVEDGLAIRRAPFFSSSSSSSFFFFIINSFEWNSLVRTLPQQSCCLHGEQWGLKSFGNFVWNKFLGFIEKQIVRVIGFSINI